MKATLDLPDELYHKVESLAARRGETVTEFVADALKTAVVEDDDDDDDRLPGYVSTGAKDPYEGLPEEERMKRWREDEAAFLELMRGPNFDPRSAVEIIREGRR